ncbi:DNA adenine methylase Dam [Beggiatoa alba B18LD]|uniref:Site-specific DNA-methyltransferase (adenine-specific) n=1 Tax=Beggiatoa alba B18LD TaxID=395493 RepID=I3CDJ7_9GAMM|nr:Dam family site-specific DNA-(adenine-N6)-methyltransferase [Beggiatoa alba]EIJ41690.1 DNA adenine methylase Dam [Beggiatoa alba B18LD]
MGKIPVRIKKIKEVKNKLYLKANQSFAMMSKETAYVPPIKIQGKKTKLVDFILKNMPNEYSTWVEPFMGSGVVGFNVKPTKAIFADSNPHIINFYNAIKSKEINHLIVKSFLQEQGKILAKKGQVYYNEVREKFNKEHQPLDFLFLNRSCFNGMIRFNRQLKFNVPYGHKPERFAQSYVTRITNQVKHIAFLIENNDWKFVCQDFRETIKLAKNNDLIYCDPPYIGRHVDYYDSWDEQNELALEKSLQNSNAKFMVSTWHSNQYRKNSYLESLWKNYTIITTAHFYHLGGKEENRNAIMEALIMNYAVETKQEFKKTPVCQQLAFKI